MVFALSIVGRAMAFLLGGLVLSAPGALLAHRRLGNEAREHKESGLWAAGDLREIAEGDAMKAVVAALVKSPAVNAMSLESQLDLHPVAAIRAAMLRAAGSTKAVDKKLAKIVATYEAASVCASTMDSAESDGPALCEAGCRLKVHTFDLSKPHRGACHALCAVVAEPREEETTWDTKKWPVAWEMWQKLAGHDIRTLLLTLLCSAWISREIACREDPAGNLREPDGEDTDNSRGSRSNSSEEGGANGAGQARGFDGSFGGRDPAVREAFEDMQRRLAAAEAAMENMRTQIAAEREQARQDMDSFDDAVFGRTRAWQR